MPISPHQYERYAIAFSQDRINNAIQEIDKKLSCPIFAAYQATNHDPLEITITAPLTMQEKQAVEKQYTQAGWSHAAIESGHGHVDFIIRLKK